MATRDTPPIDAAIQVEIHRRFTPADRLRMAMEMSEFARALSRAGLRIRRPEFTELEIDAEMLKQMYGFDLKQR